MDNVLTVLGDLFGSLTSTIFSFFEDFAYWLYDYLFIGLFDTCSSIGSNVFSALFTKVSSNSDLFSFDIIYFVLGVILIFIAIKLFVSLISSLLSGLL